MHFNPYDMVTGWLLLRVELLLKRGVSEQIQVRHETCNYGKATCICGVVVREGNSAFWISICEAGSWSEYIQRGPRVVRLLSQNPADSSTVYMDATGLKFSVSETSFACI